MGKLIKKDFQCKKVKLDSLKFHYKKYTIHYVFLSYRSSLIRGHTKTMRFEQYNSRIINMQKLLTSSLHSSSSFFFPRKRQHPSQNSQKRHSNRLQLQTCDLHLNFSKVLKDWGAAPFFQVHPFLKLYFATARYCMPCESMCDVQGSKKKTTYPANKLDQVML